MKTTFLAQDEKMPVLFIGHGSPMNAIAQNPYTEFLSDLGQRLPRPRAILVISAHWMTKGTWVTEMEHPKTIHDFYGFPKELFEVQYPAPGSPKIAQKVKATVQGTAVGGDLDKWGLDHGTWSVLRHLYPTADIPVLQLSLDMAQPVSYHFQFGQELSVLREHGILILGSGNIVHNLRQIRWEPEALPYDWAVEFDSWVKAKLKLRDFRSVTEDFLKFEAGKLSVPTLDHYLPLHYVLGAADDSDDLKFEYEEIQNGSISMRSMRFG